MARLEFRNVTRCFGDVSLSVEAGGFFTLPGPFGLRMLAGFELAGSAIKRKE